jgi:hypothetical protein
MRTITTDVYTFDELSEEAKQKAIEWYANLGLDWDWYQFIYDDAKEVGITIQGFDLDRGNMCNISIDYIDDTCTKILKNHGEQTETYKAVINYREQYNALVKKYSNGTDKVTEENEYDFDNEADELEREFTQELSECYLSLLRQEYEYRDSEDCIIENILANEYEFTKEGKRI